MHQPILDLTDLGFRVRQLRKEQGISATDLCKQAGMSRDTLHRLENGRDVNISTLFQVLNSLQTNLALQSPQAPSLEVAPAFFLESVLKAKAR